MKWLKENLEAGDLRRLVTPRLHIDEFKSKMGDDKDVCVISFKVTNKMPANDLVSFIEKGYRWVLDADVSSGEKEDGDYIVFVEIARTSELPAQIFSVIKDICLVTEQQLEDWIVYYAKSKKEYTITEEILTKIIPLTPEKYDIKFPPDNDASIDNLKLAAGIKVDTKAPINDFTESIRIAAGLK